MHKSLKVLLSTSPWILLFSMVGGCSGSSPAPAQTAGMKATVTVDAGDAVGKVNPLVFGHNVSAADSFGIFGIKHSYTSRDGEGLWNPGARALVPQAVRFSEDIGMKMMRYPGGCLAHNFNWKDAVGKPEDRPNFSFGIDEFIQYCRTVGAEPLMIISAYVGGPQDAAELVEYLNAPATPDHPWAEKRAQWGHPEPYHVRYFEMGNESDHGNHAKGGVFPFKKDTAAQYGAWFNACVKAMRAVDPSIKIGALTGTGSGPGDSWNDVMLGAVKDTADFIVVHTYAVQYAINSTDNPAENLLMRACMASDDYFDEMLGEYRDKIHRITGRDIPLAITEYNASFVQDKPEPYRFSLGAALFSADYLRVLMQPQSDVLMANYWEFINGYWGMVRKTANGWNREPAYYLFRLWGQHFGMQLVKTNVDAPRLSFEGFQKIPAMSGDKFQSGHIDTSRNLLDGASLKGASGAGYITGIDGDGTMKTTLNNFSGQQYPSITTIKTTPGMSTYISFEARATGLAGSNVGLGLADARGWSATHSAIAVENILSGTGWKSYSKPFAMLPGATGATVVWRLQSQAPVSGTLEIRHLQIHPYQPPVHPGYAAVTSAASLSADGHKLYIMIFNKHDKNDIAVTLNLQNFAAQSAKYWMVDGPSLASTNMKSEEVKETETAAPLAIANNSITHIFPAHSMTAVEVDR